MRRTRMVGAARVCLGLALILGASATTAGAAPGDVVLWNQLGNHGEVTGSEVGADGAVIDPVGFGPVQHDAGVALQSGNSQVRFDRPFGPAFPDAGTIEFWWIPAHDENSSTGSHFAERFPIVIGSDEKRPGDWPAFQLFLHYRGHAAAFNVTWLSFALYDNDTATWYSVARSYDLDFLAGQLMHVGITWDKGWGASPIRVYFDGVEGTPVTDGGTNPELLIEKVQEKLADPGYGYDLELLRYSRRPDGAQSQFDFGMYVDNLVIRDSPKTDYSDRFDENPVPQVPASSFRSIGVLALLLMGAIASTLAWRVRRSSAESG